MRVSVGEDFLQRAAVALVQCCFSAFQFVVNMLRNYTQSQMKKKAEDWMKSHQDKLPKMKDPLQCTMHTLEQKTGINKEAILFCMDYMMPKMTGSGKTFGFNVWFCETISKARSDPTSNKEAITIKMEAFGLLVIENNYTKSENYMNWRMVILVKVIILCKSSKN